MKILKDQRGLTIVELVSSFTITMMALVFLFNIVVILKESYVINAKKSEIIVNQSILSRDLNEDLFNDATSFTSYTCPSGYDLCYAVGLNGSTTKNLLISYSKNEIKYGNVTYSDDSFEILSTNTKVCRYVENSASDDKNAFLMIRVSINSSLMDNYGFGINVIHLYDPTEFEVATSVGEC